MPGRFLIYSPTIAPDTFVFFYARGTTGRSFSVRDYTSATPTLRYASDFPGLTAEQILSQAAQPGNYCLAADRVPTTNYSYWRSTIQDLNRRYLAPAIQDQPDRPALPILDQDLFDRLSKARKLGDVNRMLYSPRSEDWVTWNVFCLLEREPRDEWWRRLIGAVSHSSNVDVVLDTPTDIELWRRVTSPVAYEASNRQKMLDSDNPAWTNRAGHPGPVEGDSEIDIAMSGSEYLIFVEAKLGSDISARTTYDPARNQIVRNVDCVIEHSDGRRPLFWMLVKDRVATRAYVHLVTAYRERPELLAASLPHRDPQALTELTGTMAIVTWAELLQDVRTTEDEERRVLDEIRGRID